MSLRIPLKSGKPENTQISEIESYGGIIYIDGKRQRMAGRRYGLVI